MTQRAPNIIQGTVSGPCLFDEETILMGKVEGDARVFVGHDLTVNGTITGDLVVDHGASARVSEAGVVEGRLTNNGRVELAGEVGDLTSRRPAVAVVHSGAVIAGVRQP